MATARQPSHLATPSPRHRRGKLVRNVVHGQMYVAEFRLEDYPVSPADVLHTGKAAWDAALVAVPGAPSRASGSAAAES